MSEESPQPDAKMALDDREPKMDHEPGETWAVRLGGADEDGGRQFGRVSGGARLDGVWTSQLDRMEHQMTGMEPKSPELISENRRVLTDLEARVERLEPTAESARELLVGSEGMA